MRKTYLILSVLFFISCGENNATSETQNVEKIESKTDFENEVSSITKDISAADFKNKIAEGNYQLIDVRTPKEFEQGTIEDAKNINVLDSDFQIQIAELDKHKPVLVFCQAGGRSSRAMKIMAKNGFEEVYNLQGGYGQWPEK